MRRVLFVDDDTNVLSAVQRMLRPMRSELQTHVATSGATALEALTGDRFDVIVSDMRMPGMDGATLLNEVSCYHPGVIRIALSGQTDPEAILRVVDTAHQYVSKPCDGDELKTVLRQVLVLGDLLDNDVLKSHIASLRGLPTRPAVYVDLINELTAENPSMRRVAQIVEDDIALTAKVLHLVNSSFFGVRLQAATAERAVQMLGLDLLRALAMSGQLVTELDPASTRRFLLSEMWPRSIAMSRLVRCIAALEGVGDDVTTYAVTAAMLHDAGRLLLSTCLANEYDKVVDHAITHRVPLVDAEQDILGCTHAETGAYLFRLWGLPDPVTTAVAWHHHPSASGVDEMSPLALVHAADGIASELLPESGFVKPPVDMSFLESLDTRHDYDAWKTKCVQVVETLSTRSSDDRSIPSHQ